MDTSTLFKRLTNIIAWLQIMASPVFISIILGFIIYLSRPNTIGKIACFSIILLGFTVGAFWAHKIHKKRGAIEFLSKNISTPELDKKTESN